MRVVRSEAGLEDVRISFEVEHAAALVDEAIAGAVRAALRQAGIVAQAAGAGSTSSSSSSTAPKAAGAAVPPPATER